MPNSSWAIWLPKASPLSAAGGPPSALAAKKAADGRVPVVFTSVADPVLLGLVESIGRPGRNMTGVAGLTSELDVARLQILSEMLGGGSARIGVLNNARRPHLEEQYRTLDAEASRLKLTLVRKDAASLSEIDAAFKSFKGGPRIDALLVTADSPISGKRWWGSPTECRRSINGASSQRPAAT